MATELPENENTSITHVAEYVAAEVIERYLTSDPLEAHDPPFLWVEHYPATEAHGRTERAERAERASLIEVMGQWNAAAS